MSHSEFYLTVGKLPPILDHRHVSGIRTSIEDFAGFHTSRVNWQREYLGLRFLGHPVR
jgi:hypothetical protein